MKAYKRISCVTCLPFPHRSRCVMLIFSCVSQFLRISMTPAQIRLLQKSFIAIKPIKAQIGLDFYGKLFELAPETRAFFISNLERQWRNLMSVFEKLVSDELPSMLTVPVTDSGSKEVSLPGITELAHHYATRGAGPEHLPAAKTALLWALEQHLGEAYDEETADAWAIAFDLIAASMISVMRSEANEPVMPHDRGQQIDEHAPDKYRNEMASLSCSE